MNKEAQNESLEESIFKTLSNQKRRDILRFIGEHKQATFTKIKKAVEIEDSSLVSYHLNSLQMLINQKDEKYSLSELGQEAYNLIVKTNVYASTNVIVGVLRRQLTLLVIANAVLWMFALLTLRLFEGNIGQMTTFAFAALWLTSNGLIYAILNGTNSGKSCR